MERLFDRHRLLRYNPEQPRVPAGSPGGGQWTDGDTGAARDESDGRVRVAQNDSDRRYKVNLFEEEARGGHTLRDHVGKTEAEVLNSVRNSQRSTPVVTTGRRRHGSFYSQGEANDLVNRTLEKNFDAVEEVAQGRRDQVFVTHRFGSKTGFEAYQPDDLRAQPYIRDTYGVGVLVRPDPSSPRGYRVHTAYPRNDDVP